MAIPVFFHILVVKLNQLNLEIMGKKKVFVVVIDQMSDCERVLDTVDVFDTEEKARSKYNEFVEKEKKWIKDEEREDWEVNETENSFDAFEDGYYSQNHSYARIEVKEVQ